MAKFGEIIHTKKPVLISFYNDQDSLDYTQEMLSQVQVVFDQRVKVVKIDVEKNQLLAKALQVQGIPTNIIYKNGDMQWRQTGVQEVKFILKLITKYL